MSESDRDENDLVDAEKVKAVKTGQKKKRPKVPMPVGRNATEYNMNHPKRGYALILSHQEYDNPKLTTRIEVENDCNNLSANLRKIGFKVIVCRD